MPTTIPVETPEKKIMPVLIRTRPRTRRPFSLLELLSSDPPHPADPASVELVALDPIPNRALRDPQNRRRLLDGQPPGRKIVNHCGNF